MLQIATGTTYGPKSSRVAGSGGFVSLYVLVVGAWTVQLYIGLAELIEKKDAALGCLTEKNVEECQKKRDIIGQNPCSTTIGNHLPKS
ncbi:hypothetical protein [Microcoleus sp. herbarium2]|uniref:hypothetical protein n=1 Tax=Microcoleus sp. herbarium2 TaxID=3055433 RepID=UPI002FD20842